MGTQGPHSVDGFHPMYQTKPSVWLSKYKIKCKIIKNDLDFDTVSERI